MKDVTVVIISYNTRDLTLGAIGSVLRETTRSSFEIVVVDNNSGDGSASAIRDQFPSVRLIALDHNLGFGPANNLATEGAEGRWILLLNPDTIILEQAIDRLVDYADAHPQHGIYGGRTVFPSGELNPTSCWGEPTLWSMFCRAVGLAAVFRDSLLFDPESLGAWERDTIREVPIVCGCFLLIKADLWRALGGFDPQFTMYAEEFDLAFRARKRGARPVICPHATIVHYGGASDRVLADQTVRQYSARSRLIRKHWTPRRARLGVACLDLWALNKLVRSYMRAALNAGHQDAAATWRQIWSRRTEWRTPALSIDPRSASPATSPRPR